MQYNHFIAENIAFPTVRRIGIYNGSGNRVGMVPLGHLTFPDAGNKLYTFGALSDVHIGESTSESDFKRALADLSASADFICICGDLIHGWSGDNAAAHIEAQIGSYIACVETCATVPVYACSGNHDGAYIENIESAIASYTGQPLYYSVPYANDVFIFVGLQSDHSGNLFTRAELQWLYETLETNRNKRCFVFQHVRPDDACGNALGVYTYDIWSGTEKTVFESLLQHYKNAHLFHGHSHLRFSLQAYDKTATVARDFGGWSIHIPSISVPRDINSAVNPCIENVYAESEGYVVDVYKNGIHLQGRDFNKSRNFPIASYWLDTTVQNIDGGTYVDPTGTISI